MIFDGWRCSECEALFVSDHARCVACGSSNVKKEPLAGSGRIVTYTTVRVPPEKFAEDGVFAVGLVELEEGPRITARLSADSTDVSIGQEVRVREVSRELGPIFETVE